MGQRANLIIIEDGKYTLRYDHWCANRLDKILFWGIGYALDYFEAQDKVGEEGWLDEIWAEGGAILDLDKKHLLWWGGEDVLYNVNLRLVYLKMQAKVWKDWTVEWANRGIVDLAEYVGYPKEKVLTSRENLSEPTPVKFETGENFWAETIGCLKTADGEIRLFALAAWCENYLFNGEDLVGHCKSERSLEKINWNELPQKDDFPLGGFWIDEGNRTVEFWQVQVCPNVVQDLKKLWGDWEIVWHQDRYEFLQEKLGDKLILPEVKEKQLFNELRENLLREDGRSGLSSALDVNEALRETGKSVQINPWLFKSHHVEQPLESKIQIWRRNFGE